MNVAIIGCGYVGKAVARLWTQQSLDVTATTTTPARLPELAAIAQRSVLLNGSDATAVRTLLDRQQVVLLCLGARNAQSYEETYLQTAKTLTHVLPQCPDIRQLIYTSSYALYGNQQGNWVDETSPIAPASPNTEILAATERVLLNAADGNLNVCIFRLAGIYGPGRTLARIFQRLAGTTQPGDGSNPSNWVHLDDIVGAIEFARQHRLQGIYNLVNDRPLPRRKLLEQVCAAYNLSPVAWDPAQPSKRPYNVSVSNHKLKQAGYTFSHPEINVLDGT